MMQKFIPIALAIALAFLGSVRIAHAGTKSERVEADRARLAAKVKAGILKLGTGSDARISVRQRGGEKVEGFVADADDATFTVVSASGSATQLPYGDVTQVKGHNLATGWKIVIGASIAVGVAFLILVIFLATNTR